MSFPRPDEQEACGAMNRQGEPCKNWPAHMSTGVHRRCRFHGGHSLQGLAHPGYRHGLRSRGLRELSEVLHRGAILRIGTAIALTEVVRAKRAELVALASTIGELQGMTKAEIRASLGLPLSPGDIVIR